MAHKRAFEVPNLDLRDGKQFGSSRPPPPAHPVPRIEAPNHRFSVDTVDERPWPTHVGPWTEGAIPVRKGPADMAPRKAR